MDQSEIDNLANLYKWLKVFHLNGCKEQAKIIEDNIKILEDKLLEDMYNESAIRD